MEEHSSEAYGPRLSTVLIYLNDVTQGGCTHFVDLNIDVQPIAGSAIFWHNVCPDAASSSTVPLPPAASAGSMPPPPGQSETSHLRPDARTTHAGMPVATGDKYVALKWIHAGPFRGPYLEE